ncbi:hypothetical protein ASD22_09475 [Rhodanobacter sp. Root480]|uniref:hypothetical protein n=1 Tax=Rhodanobacter sp. Root480 TaxID=1736542 RepID=UPI00070148B9|nr:hypothetical protein [Rhodanobacter sp. Root480]KQX97481.1 hypothetical protein ASD22_09475 [Rhodanobacter sp. Root480]
MAACVWLLSAPDWWQWSNLKNTLLWTGSFALVAAFKYEKVESGTSYFRATVLEAISITAFLSFVSSSYTFGLIAEAIVFSLIVLGITSAIAERAGKLKYVHNMATGLLILLSLLILGNSIYYIVIDFSDFATSHTARDFTLPVLLTIMFLPFLGRAFRQDSCPDEKKPTSGNRSCVASTRASMPSPCRLPCGPVDHDSPPHK